MGYAAAAFYGYVGVIGLALFLAFKWLFRAELSLSQVWCTYGKLYAHEPLHMPRLPDMRTAACSFCFPYPGRQSGWLGSWNLAACPRVTLVLYHYHMFSHACT